MNPGRLRHQLAAFIAVLCLINIGCKAPSALEEQLNFAPDSVGLIYTTGFGQGVAVTKDNQAHILTAAHVVAESSSDQLQIAFQGRTSLARKQQVDVVGDFATLSTNMLLKPLEISPDAEVTDPVFLVSRESDGKLKIARMTPLMTGLNLPIPAQNDRPQLYLENIGFVSGRATPGDSGGAIVNNRGQLLGILLGRSESQGLLFYRQVTAANFSPASIKQTQAPTSPTDWLIDGFVRAAKIHELELERASFVDMERQLPTELPPAQRQQQLWRAGLKALMSAKRERQSK